MKKYVFLLLGLMVSISILSQNQRTIEIFNEDFSSGVPPTGWTIENMDEQWSQAFSSHAGGTSPEAQLHWSNGNFSTRLISPESDLMGFSTIMFSFKHFLSNYSGGNIIGVSTRSGGGAWSDVWSITTSEDIGPEVKDILISNSDVGASDFQISLYLSGEFHNFNEWYIDDAHLYYPNNIDVEMVSVNVLPYGEAGDYDLISCTFKNIGFSTINNMDINYQFDDGSVITENIGGLDLQTTDTMDYTFNTPWEATSGNYVLNVWISNANNNGNDDDTSNDIKSKNISVASQIFDNVPLFEVFTSSTCSPCNYFNTEIMNPFMQEHPNDIAVIKYQMSWPAPGDPYYTEEGGVRKQFYGVSHVPSLYAGGNQTSTDASSLNTAFTSESTRASYFDMSSSIEIMNDEVHFLVAITPYINAEMRLHIAVVEKQTTGNVGTNGETSFEHVMMKMIPDADGQLIDFTSPTIFIFFGSGDMSSTNVEELEDLMIVAFVQDDDTKQIMQSTVANQPLGLNDNNLQNVGMYPNPSRGNLNIVTDKEIQVIIHDILGKKVFSKKRINTEVLDLTHLNNGMYLVSLKDGDSQVTKKLIINK